MSVMWGLFYQLGEIGDWRLAVGSGILGEMGLSHVKRRYPAHFYKKIPPAFEADGGIVMQSMSGEELLGCWLAWNRLGDFTLTADRLRWKMEEPPFIANSDTKKMRNEMKEDAYKLGKMTRWLLLARFWAFLIVFSLSLQISYVIFWDNS
ncbi:MAG: hypothetical protein HND47_14800 [Chloroflexi bacterium]|nr:hypothetical protein [Chloroflexota bacterium]